MTRALFVAAVVPLLSAAGASAEGAGPEVRSGKLAFVSAGDIWTVAPDGSDLDNRTRTPGARDLSPAWSPSGTRIVFASNRSGRQELWIMDAYGTGLRRLTNNRKSRAVDATPSVSPDGRRLAFARRVRGDFEIYTMNLDGTRVRRLTRYRGVDSEPAWSPDGKRIAFTRTLRPRGPRPARQVFVMTANGSNLRRLTWGAVSYAPSWSPDGTRLCITRVAAHAGEDIWMVGASGGSPRRLIVGPANEGHAVWAPDGHALAFSSDRADGTRNIFVDPADPRRPAARVTQFRDPTTGAVMPAWQSLPS